MPADFGFVRWTAIKVSLARELSRAEVAGKKLHHALLLAEFYDGVAASRHVRAEHGHEFIRFSGHEQRIAEL
jgi:hypothetical protein